MFSSTFLLCILYNCVCFNNVVNIIFLRISTLFNGWLSMNSPMCFICNSFGANIDFLFLNNYFDLCQGTFTSSSVSDWIKPEKHQTLAECDKDIHIEGCFLFVQVCYVISKLWCFNKMQFVFFRPIFIYMLPENAYANLLNPKWYPLRYVLHCKHTLFR